MNSAPRVLVIDDDEAIREFVILALSDEGYEVFGVPNGAAALEILAAVRPDVILLDTRMPLMSGIEFAQHYRQRTGPHAPIVVLTAASDADSVAQQIAAVEYLPKPFDLDDLLQVVRRLTHHR